MGSNKRRIKGGNGYSICFFKAEEGIREVVSFGVCRFFFQAEDGILAVERSGGLGDVYNGQDQERVLRLKRGPIHPQDVGHRGR